MNDCTKKLKRSEILNFANKRPDHTPILTQYPHPLPALLLAPFLARSSVLVPRSLLNSKPHETLATQATRIHFRPPLSEDPSSIVSWSPSKWLQSHLMYW